ncbi:MULTISPECIES: BrnT family toxin [Erwinia]|uniref:BrnT family toxin n=2 Tax=Erwinia TaxID=551 RepID=B2VD33_ERWT9|nr:MULTISPECIES: BrnT family toxin [Erwinia]CAO95886.1 Conserved hypothetical protein [Erwinia tasmaniensis Et1/99]CCG88220.1 hypothetical protein EPIR_2857 [Erwinia piriflorinigrans CFBP 5888]
MDICYDPDKDVKNRRKHGYSLADSALLDWDEMVVYEDNRQPFDEIRLIGLTYGLARLGNRIFSVCFTEHEEVYRIISLRLATRKEIQRYAET